MEDFLMNLHQEVKNDPLTTMNMILTFFTVVSFGRLCSEMFTSFCFKNRNNNKIDQILHHVKNLPNNADKLEELEFTLDQLQATVERMNSYITQIHFQVCANPQNDGSQSEQSQSEQSQSQSESEQSQEQSQSEQSQEQSQSQSQEQAQDEELQPQVPTVETIKTPKDKHTQLIAALKHGDTVSLKYKKQAFDATFIIQPTAQHGYLLKCGATEYNTPSHFSYAKKLTLNEKLHSDNGWDTVYVTRDKKKVSLNALLQS